MMNNSPAASYDSNAKYEVPVVVYPVRGRFNPYWYFVVPLITASLTSALCSLGALIASGLIPYNGQLFRQLAPDHYKAAVVLAVIVYSITLGITGFIVASYVAILFNIFDNKYTTVAIDVRKRYLDKIFHL